MQDPLSFTELYHYFYDAKVVICGGAHVYNKHAPGDFWIRINNHVIRQQGRCDAIFSSASEPLKCQASLICYPHNAPYTAQHDRVSQQRNALNYKYITQRQKGINNYSLEQEPLNILYNKLKTLPFTGMIALMIMQQLPVRSIYLTGMTMYLDDNTNIKKTLTGNFIRKRDSHLIAPQVNYLIDALEYDARVDADIILKKNLKKYVQGRDTIQNLGIISLN